MTVKKRPCLFCQEYKTGGLMRTHPDFRDYKCERWIKEDWGDGIVGFLSKNQYVPGHTIVMPVKHFTRIDDKNLDVTTITNLFSSINKISARMMKRLHPNPIRIYVMALCEDVEHLHLHLIPRYPAEWRSNSDEKDIVQVFKKMYRPKADTPGFWYAAFHEARWNRKHWEDFPKGKEVKTMEAIAKQIRIFPSKELRI